VVKLVCNEYGFECDYVVEGDEDTVVDSFTAHMNEAHGIEYSREAIVQFVQRKRRP